jgi:hypothetical protein
MRVKFDLSNRDIRRMICTAVRERLQMMFIPEDISIKVCIDLWEEDKVTIVAETDE